LRNPGSAWLRAQADEGEEQPNGDVRYGSEADFGHGIRDVRFAPESGHDQLQDRCLLCARSGLWGSRLAQATSEPMVPGSPVRHWGLGGASVPRV